MGGAGERGSNKPIASWGVGGDSWARARGPYPRPFPEGPADRILSKAARVDGWSQPRGVPGRQTCAFTGPRVEAFARGGVQWR